MKIFESLKLKKWDNYIKLIAYYYKALPNMDESVKESWLALNQHSRKMFKQLTSSVDIIFVYGDIKWKNEFSGDKDYIEEFGKRFPVKYFKGGQPYDTQPQMMSDVKNNKRMLVSIDFGSHPIFSNIDNCYFRAVHDYIVHIGGNFDFSGKGEIQAYNKHAKLAPKIAKAALFTEVVGQASYFVTFDNFPTQKIAVMKGVNFDEVGYIDNVDDIEAELKRLNAL